MSEEEGPFLLDDFFDTIQPKKGMATKREIDEMLVFIGGFEKWPVLIEDCRREVIKYLDYESRFNLGICSKDDHETVEKMKICVESIEIKDTQKLHYFFNKMDKFDNVTVSIQFPTGNPFEWVFSQLEQDTRVQWVHRIHTQRPVVREVIWKSCNSYQESVKFAEKWMKNPILNSKRSQLRWQNIHLQTVKSSRCRAWWLKKCPEELESITLDVYSKDRKLLILSSDFLNTPQVKQASVIESSFYCRAAYSDEQLLELKVKSMHLSSADVTDNGINKFIRKWVYGEAVDGFMDLQLWGTTVRDPDVMLAGLDEVKEWDKEFEKEQWEFVGEFDRVYGWVRCYQIKSKVDRFESLTLGVYDGCVLIVATGDFEKVANTPISVRGIEILDDESIGGIVTDIIMVRIQLESFDRLEYAFSPLGEQDTQVQWLQCGQKSNC
ncbi:unnamed protein product [Caenorhabditis brenneri]